MKILIVTQCYPPEPMKQLSDLAETLQYQGHDVAVLTGLPNWPSGQLAPGYRQRLFQRELYDGVALTRVPLYPDHSRSAFRRIANFGSYALSASALGPWVTERPDVVHLIHPPITAGLPAWLISRRFGVPLTMEIQDMWPETLAATGMFNHRTGLRMVGAFASWVYRRAAAIRVISPGFKANLIAKGVPADKIHVISNWVDADFCQPVEPDPELARAHGLEGRFNITYAGTMGMAQGIGTVLVAAEILQPHRQIQFVLIGDGVDYERLRQAADDRGLSNVRFLGRHPGDRMPAFYALSDVLLVQLRDDPLFRITIPHKVFTYLAAGRPVLAASTGDLADVVRRAGAGVACRPGDPEDLARAALELYQMPLAGRQHMGRNGRAAAVNSYSRARLVGQIGEMLASVVQRPRTHRLESPTQMAP